MLEDSSSSMKEHGRTTCDQIGTRKLVLQPFKEADLARSECCTMGPFKCESWTYHELLALCFHGFLFAWGQANIQVWGYLIREFLACIFSTIHAWFLNILDIKLECWISFWTIDLVEN
jgi:hypothetical protein